MSIEWSEDLSTGIADIDEQHKELFLRFNALEDACRQQRGLDEIGRYMDYLMEYTAYHFAAEEREMSRYSYTGLQRHHQEHEQFKREINALYNEIRVTGARMTLVQTTRWASMEWLVAHVKNTDGEMAAFLKAQAG